MPESKWEMPAVCHLLNLTCVQEMKSYRVPLSNGLAGVRHVAQPDKKRWRVAFQASKYAKQELAALESGALVFGVFLLFCFFSNPYPSPAFDIPTKLGELGRERKLMLPSAFVKFREARCQLLWALQEPRWGFYPLGDAPFPNYDPLLLGIWWIFFPPWSVLYKQGNFQGHR